MKYHIKRYWLENIKHLQSYLGTSISHMQPRFFMALEQTNPGCVVTWKTFDSHIHNTEVFQRVFWAFHASIEGFNHCRPILSIDGTHLYEKYKDTLMITIGCDGNNKFFFY